MKKILTILVTLSILLGAAAIAVPAIMAEDDTEAPVNVALDKPATATSAYNYPVFGWSPAGLTDGTTSHGWHDGVGSEPTHDITADAPVDLTIDLQALCTISTIKLIVADSYKNGSGCLPASYELQVSTDGQSWTTVASETQSVYTKGQSLDYEFDAVDASYVRMHITEDSRQHGNLTAIGELEVWGVPMPVVKDPIYNWQDPVYADMETSADDSYAGTLKYTPADDGSTVTISYEKDGKTASYTVPNNRDYLFGGYAGVDDLGRVLSDSDGVGAVKAENERYVGLFYFLWHGAHDAAGTTGVARNLQAILDGTSKVGYGIRDEMHWFAEPLYGYYFANDVWVLRKHAELLTNAGVDFLFFDTTNNFTYSRTALKLMAILHELNEQGFDAPEVVFYTNHEAVTRIGQIYTDIYAKEMYPDTWFCIDGKPVIVAPNIHEQTLPDGKRIADFYTVKSGNWPNASGGAQIENNFEPNNNCWTWMDWHWPQRVYTDANGENGAVNVSIAQHSGAGNFSSSTLEGFKFNRGRSFVSNGQVSDDITYNSANRPFNMELLNSYKAAAADPTLSYRGLNFQEQFDYAIASNAKYILVTGWNEWVAGNQGTPEDPAFVDTASIEFSRDSEMMRGGYFDNYYMQLIQNIRRVKGTAPVLVQDMRKPINVTGEFDQWADIAVTYTDPMGDTADRNGRGYGEEGYTTYINTSGRNDIVATKVVSDTGNLHFYIETAGPITQYDAASSWMQIYINADRDVATGWYGYDYIVNYKATGDFETTIAKYTGVNGAYGFAEAGTVAYRVKGNQMMLTVPQALLGIQEQAIDLEFKVADSRTVYDEMEDFYCDGDVAPLGRLNYVYCNGTTAAESETTTPDVTETIPETVAGPETDAETSADIGAESPAETQAETTPEKGCGSVVLSTSVAALMLPGAAALVLRRKEG